MRALVAAVALGAAQAALAQTGEWSWGAGAQYSSGDYGTGQSTRILAVPLSLQYDAQPWKLRFSLPWYHVSGGTSVVPGFGAADRGRRRGGGDTSVSGLGDLSAAATNSAYYDPASRFGVDFTGKVKLPTGEKDKGLSSGSTDLTIQADAYKGLDERTTVFGGLGYTVFFGGFLDLRNAVSYSLGASRKLDERESVGLSFDGRTQVVRGVSEQRELMAFWSRSFARSSKLQAHFLVGLADGSPDWGIGASVLRAF